MYSNEENEENVRRKRNNAKGSNYVLLEKGMTHCTYMAYKYITGVDLVKTFRGQNLSFKRFFALFPAKSHK